jgi:histidinol dehydrogenase
MIGQKLSITGNKTKQKVENMFDKSVVELSVKSENIATASSQISQEVVKEFKTFKKQQINFEIGK